MNNCGNCANYDHAKMKHTDVCGKCVTAYKGTVRQEPSNWRALPQTNADRIRSMTDEELAEHLEDWQCWGGGMSKEWWLEWLKQPVEEE